VSLTPYRRVLGRPGVPALLIISLLARIPITAAPVILALHVVLDMGRGFTDSGLLAASFAIGGALGAPVVGRAIDQVGLRPVLILTTVVDGAFWLIAGQLSYWPLVATAFAGGLLAIPVYSLSRQALAAMVPPADRQAGFSLDSMSVEMSFAVGPALGIVMLTQAGATATLLTAAALIVVAGIALIALDPPVRGEEGATPPARGTAQSRRADRRRPTSPPVPLRSWWSAGVGAVILTTAATTFIVAGTDTALTAVMRSFGQVSLIGAVFAIWCLASLVGGFIYGASRRINPIVMLALLAALCIPAALASSWWMLAILVIPTGLFCAPMISSTAQELVRLTPANARGQVMGIHGSALTLGNALGAPFVGIVVDHAHPRYGFVAIGLLGLALAVALLPANRRREHEHAIAATGAAEPALTP
jgi:MFS family permease